MPQSSFFNLKMLLITTTRSLCRHKTILELGKHAERTYSSMFAWRINEPATSNTSSNIIDQLKYDSAKLPTISSPWDVLVKVHSASINPLDIRMIQGYGSRILDLMQVATNLEPRITNDRYPLTLGRDFSGEVIASGPYASRFKVGDLVYGAVEPQKAGSHAEFVIAPSYCIAKKPENLSHTEAASIPFIALTAFSAIRTVGNLSQSNCDRKKVLILGGSGGIGSFAIQLLKYWGANVVATCSEDKIDWLESTLFVDQAICHHDQSQLETLKGRFDFILDCGDYSNVSKSRHEIVEASLDYLKPFNKGIYVTLSPPLLRNTDHNGLVLGLGQTALEAAYDTLQSIRNLNSARWAFFLPNARALDYMTRLYEDQAIIPIVDSTFSFNQMPSAFQELMSGRTKGKVVVNIVEPKPDSLTS